MIIIMMMIMIMMSVDECRRIMMMMMMLIMILSVCRQPVLEGLGWVTHWFYLPLALAVPTPQMLVHTELNFIYQFLIHTEFLGDLGVLGSVLNTASHHRVHHGANRC